LKAVHILLERNDNSATVAQLDAEIIKLLHQRAEAELELIKGSASSIQTSYPDRVVEVYGRIEADPAGILSTAAIKSIYREIVSATFALSKPSVVAYLGPPATFTHMACMRGFGSSAELQPVGSIPQVFEEVERGRADYGVVPVENSTEGIVTYTIDMFIDSRLKICGEIQQQISQNLLTRADDLKAIDKVYSHPQALAQCRLWLEDNLRGVQLIEVKSTSLAAEMAAGDANAAAVAGEAAAPIYDLRVLEADIQDNYNNYTRFFIIGDREAAPTGKDKTSLLFSVKHEVGALFKTLKVLSDNHLNLTQIESRPSKKRAWEYVFFVDFEGHMEQEEVTAAVRDMEDVCLFIKVLGSYPRSE
jgi:chorismate mutase/prephenate dehydratase